MRSIGLVAILALILTASAQSAARSSRPTTYHLRYFETYGGNQSGDAFLGVVAHGSLSLAVTGGSPIPGLAAGGTFVTRYDIDANGTYRGLLVVTFASRALGTMCLDASITVGAFKPGASFPPAIATFTSIGGTGGSAKLRLTGKANATQIVGGAKDERITAKGGLTVVAGAPKAPTKACLAVAKLPRR